MIFKVIGTNVETGQRFAATIKAPDAESAQGAAARRGITVESVTEVVQAAAPASAPPKARTAPAKLTAPAKPPMKPTALTSPPQRVSTILQGMSEAVPTLEDPAEDDVQVAPAYVPRSSRQAPPPPHYDEQPPHEELAEPVYAEPAQEYVAPPARRRASSGSSFLSSNIAKIAVAAAAVLLLSLGGWAAWAWLGGSRGAAAFRAYVPANATFMGYVNVAKLQASPMYKDNEVLLKNMIVQAKQFAGLNEMERIFVAGVSSDQSEMFFIEQLKTDVSSAEILRSGGGRVTVEGLDVAIVSSGPQTIYLAKVAPKMILGAMKKEILAMAIRQSKAPAAKLDDAMERALADVNGEDNVLVFSNKTMPQAAMTPEAAKVKAVALGFSVGSEVSLRIAAVANDATDAAALLQKAKPMLGSQNEALPQLKSIADKLEMTSSGDMAHVHGKWAYADLKGLVGQISSMGQAMGRGN